MGPPDAPIYSAVGDNVNIAARFEVSAETLAHAGLEPRGAPLHRVRSRNERMDVYAINDPRTLFQ